MKNALSPATRRRSRAIFATRPKGCRSLRPFVPKVLLGLILLVPFPVKPTCAERTWPVLPGIFNSSQERYRLSREKLERICASLERVTGWRGVHFEHDAWLCLQEAHLTTIGSPTARALVLKAIRETIIVLEDRSRSLDVAFAAIRHEATYHKASGEHLPLFSLWVDFEDFQHLRGHPEALAAFDLGLVLLHELTHAAFDRRDPPSSRGASDPGECEALVNQVRAELGLPLRAHYHFEHVIPSLLSDLSFGRLRFERVIYREGKPRREIYIIQWPKSFVSN
ncbi:MAG: hypothetical protein N0A16_12095 [Blastocatellia bacterium]|nr:hypothetical protein [Blastocatellia bacterium]MCS7158454.1 hypothetical protein [Blastocatellia bacterium]MCX7753474.1 hypothetical protein [Blastocatellia bacterium]MDW8167865.1 hypothetical protein [Acidobacteriota bacterium]MDW8255899.1 hypothetical protein [Acidobacteriota bacterium]